METVKIGDFDRATEVLKVDSGPSSYVRNGDKWTLRSGEGVLRAFSSTTNVGDCGSHRSLTKIGTRFFRPSTGASRSGVGTIVQVLGCGQTDQCPQPKWEPQGMLWKGTEAKEEATSRLSIQCSTKRLHN